MGKAKTMTEHVVAGGVSGIAARTCIAPIERLKIIYQLNSAFQTNVRYHREKYFQRRWSSWIVERKHTRSDT